MNDPAKPDDSLEYSSKFGVIHISLLSAKVELSALKLKNIKIINLRNIFVLPQLEPPLTNMFK